MLLDTKPASPDSRRKSGKGGRRTDENCTFAFREPATYLGGALDPLAGENIIRKLVGRLGGDAVKRGRAAEIERQRAA